MIGEKFRDLPSDAREVLQLQVADSAAYIISVNLVLTVWFGLFRCKLRQQHVGSDSSTTGTLRFRIHSFANSARDRISVDSRWELEVCLVHGDRLHDDGLRDAVEDVVDLLRKLFVELEVVLQSN